MSVFDIISEVRFYSLADNKRVIVYLTNKDGDLVEEKKSEFQGYSQIPDNNVVDTYSTIYYDESLNKIFVEKSSVFQRKMNEIQGVVAFF